MARKNGPTILQDELYPPPGTASREEVEDARLLDLEEEQESPFLRGQKRVSVRRGTLPKKTAQRLIWAAISFTLLLILGTGAAALYHYGERSWRFRIDSSDNIEISGLQNVTRSQVVEVMGGDIGRNIFFVPLSDRKAHLEQIPWVESASVMRFVPNRLRVDIHERTPIAFARIGSRINLIDPSGVLMDLPATSKRKYSFPVIAGMNSGEPLSTRGPRMKIYNALVRDLDSDGALYSQALSEVDLSDPDDVKVAVADPSGEVLVHLGSSDFLERYKVYVTHIQEWRQRFSKVESVDLRYGGQIIVNPDLREMPRQPMLSPAAAKAAMSAGVKRAALVNYEKFAARPLDSPVAKVQAKHEQPVALKVSVDPKAPAKNVVLNAPSVKTATPKPAVKAAKSPTHKGRPKTKWKSTVKKPQTKSAAKMHSNKPAAPTGSHAASGIAGQNQTAPISIKKKPTPAIAKGQDHP
jgi:cell division protein FtsQ